METKFNVGQVVEIGKAYKCGHLGNKNNIKEGASYESDEWTGRVGEILTAERDGSLGIAFGGHDEVEVWISSTRVMEVQ